MAEGNLSRRDESESRKRQSIELLRNTLTDWGLVYGRKIGDQESEVWMRIFVATDSKLLARALEQLTREAERMPTPGALTKAIQSVREKDATLAEGVRNCGCHDCSGDGYRVVVRDGRTFAEKCPCHASHLYITHSYRHTFDEHGIPCHIDEVTGDVEYAAVDCPEGKVCRALFEDLRDHASVPQEKRDRQSGTVDCPDCKQRYPLKDFIAHTCPERAKALERIERRRRSA